MATPVSPLTSASLDATTPMPTKIEGAAKQFESLMIAQMLRTAREETSDDDSDSTGETMQDVADQQFAQVLANNGGMGIASLIAKGLQQRIDQGQPNANQQ